MEKEEGKTNDGKKIKLITPSILSHPTKNEGALQSPMLTAIKAQLEKFKFPIANHDVLIKELSASDKTKSKVDATKAINNLPIAFFPIKSIKDFEEKIAEFLSPDVISRLKHPTSARPPLFNSKEKK